MPGVLRVLPDTGLREEADYFGPEGERLFSFQHVGPSGRREGILIASPLLADFRKNYLREVALARALATKGYPVQRFHYRGVGHSEGSPTNVTFETLSDDVVRAADHLASTCRVEVDVVVATRLAALIAARSLNRIGATALVLWHPVVDPAAYFREAARARSLRDLRDGRTTPAANVGFAHELEERGQIDILGYSIHKALYESMSRRSLVQEIDKPPRSTLCVTLGQSGSRRTEKAVFARWAALGASVTQATIQSDGAWWLFASEDEHPGPGLISDPTVELTRDWICGLASKSRET